MFNLNEIDSFKLKLVIEVRQIRNPKRKEIPFIFTSKQKKKKKYPSGIKFDRLVCIPFHIQFKWRDELMYFLLDLIPSGLTGLEPAASALTGRCSDQLNYNPSEKGDLAEIFILFISASSLYER